VLGLLSLVFWSLVLIVCVKYLLFVLRADNRGEGGILALLALTLASGPGTGRRRLVLTTLGIFGAALLYGDGIITPCITVLGAVEGLEVATPVFTHYIVPISILVLVGLFALQRFGTGGMGSVFGPITLVWFVTIGALGIRGIAMEPAVMWALNPWHAVRFLMANGRIAVVVLGSVFLAVTGAEALYADLGHFGAKPIRLAWFVVVFPSLVLNYFGQGALMISRPETVGNPFYYLAPAWALYPLVALATAASVIASQALISGAFSLTMQGIQLGYLPRMEIRHTSMHARGQIYMPLVNWALMLACIALVLGFRSSGNLSAAYGIAVTLAIVGEEKPHVDPAERVHVERLAAGFVRVIARSGFMETPDIGQVFLACREQGLALSAGSCSFFLSRETIVRGQRPLMARWRSRLFAFLSRNAQTAAAFFGLPANRVVELGLQVEL
jgi:KUP system potassium uptake protein